MKKQKFSKKVIIIWILLLFLFFILNYNSTAKTEYKLANNSIDNNNYFKNIFEINDPLISKQYYIDSKIFDIWNTICHSNLDKIEPITVAIVDSGLDVDHPDLKANIWVNEDERRGNGKDDDNNGYVDDIHGYDFVANGKGPEKEDLNEPDPDISDVLGHGTHLAGIVGAVHDNCVGIAGIIPHVRLMGVRVSYLNYGGNGGVIPKDAAKGIRYAVDNGADIILIGWGGPKDVRVLSKAVKYADKKGVIIVAPAGNKGKRISYYPAAYDCVVGVGAVDKKGNKLRLSNRGKSADCYSQGEEIWGPRPEDKYKNCTGTSYAAAVKAGRMGLKKLVENYLILVGETK